jgi:hypothetical protein
VEAAERALAEDLWRAFAVLSTHAPARAKAWAKANKRAASDPVLKAALGQRVDDEDLSFGVATVTPDPALAIRAWKAIATMDSESAAALVALGERAQADAALEGVLAKIKKQPAAARVKDCSWFAQRAVEAGRPDLAIAARKLQSAASRNSNTACEMVRAFARLGDFGSALAALELVGEDQRVNAAVEHGLGGAQEGRWAPPSWRVISAAAARSAMARGDRAHIEWLLVVAKDRLPADVLVEIDGFLEK